MCSDICQVDILDYLCCSSVRTLKTWSILNVHCTPWRWNTHIGPCGKRDHWRLLLVVKQELYDLNFARANDT